MMRNNVPATGLIRLMGAAADLDGEADVLSGSSNFYEFVESF